MIGLGALWNRIIMRGSQSGMTELEFLETEIVRFLQSKARADMMIGHSYYKGAQDILAKERIIIGEHGGKQAVHNLPNAKIVDNQFAKLVDQKANYLLAKKVDVKPADGANAAYIDALASVFGAGFCRQLKNVGKDSLKGGICWLYPFVDDGGNLRFKRFPAYQVLPFWRDDEHTILDAAARVYTVTVYEGRTIKPVTKVEYYTADGVKYYILDSEHLIPDNAMTDSAYITVDGKPMNWERIPLIPFKSNADEIPLINRVKCLQDGLNQLESSFADAMTEDVRSSVLVLYNYDGTDLGEFRRNLATYGAVKIRRDDYAKGGVEVLHIDVNADNYKQIIQMFKRSIIENGRGFDAKDERFAAGNVNQMNIQSAYADIDLDADEMQSEFTASLQQLLWFVNTFLAAKGITGGDVDFIFNRDMMVNASERITDAKNSVGILSEETIVANHPWTKDTQEELDRIKKEKEEQLSMFDPYGGRKSSSENEE